MQIWTFLPSLETTSTNLWVFYSRCSGRWASVECENSWKQVNLPFSTTVWDDTFDDVTWYQVMIWPNTSHVFIDFSLSLRPGRVAWRLASILKESLGLWRVRQKSTYFVSLEANPKTSFCSLKMLVTTSPLHLLFHFQCCLQLGYQGLSIFTDKQQPQAETLQRWQIHSNKERCKAKMIEPWLGKDFSQSWVDYSPLEECMDVAHVKTPPPLPDEKCPKKILLFWLFTRKTSPHGYGLKDLVEAILEIDKEPSASRDPKRVNRMVGKWESHLVESFF